MVQGTEFSRRWCSSSRPLGSLLPPSSSNVADRRFSNALATSAKAMFVEPPPIVIQETRIPRATRDGCSHGKLGNAFYFPNPFHNSRRNNRLGLHRLYHADNRFGPWSLRNRHPTQRLHGPVEQIVVSFLALVFHLKNPHSSTVNLSSASINSSCNRRRARCSSTPTALVVRPSRSPTSP